MVGNQDFRRENLSSMVAEYIKQKILTGEYKEGDHILEANIAQKLGISRAPVREGIRELQDQGLIESIPRKGNFVAQMSIKDIKEIFDIRILLENYVLEKIINENKLTSNDFLELTCLIDKMVEIAEGKGELSEKIIRINEKDIEFHTFLWHKSGSTRVSKMLLNLHFQLQIAMVIDSRLTSNLDKIAKNHYNIIKHLQNKDLPLCLTALKSSIATYKLFEDSKLL